MKVLVVILVIAAAAGGAYLFISNDEEPADVATPAPTQTASESPTLEPEPTSSDPVAKDCSAADATIASDTVDTVADLPPAVFDTWTSIVDLAMDCDYEGLEDLALQGTGFSYSFGDDGSPASFWRAREREARQQDLPTSEYMRYLVATIQLPYCEESSSGDTYFIWPRVHCREHTDADWDDIEGLYPEDQFEQMRASDSFLGFRVGILEDGDWVYFVAGD